MAFLWRLCITSQNLLCARVRDLQSQMNLAPISGSRMHAFAKTGRLAAASLSFSLSRSHLLAAKQIDLIFNFIMLFFQRRDVNG